MSLLEKLIGAKTLPKSVAESKETQFKIARFARLKVNQPDGYIQGTAREALAELAERVIIAPRDTDNNIQETKARTPMFHLGSLRAGLDAGASMAKGDSFEHMQGVPFDVDHVTPAQLAEFIARVEKMDWLHLRYPTYQHTDENPRYRFVFLFSRPAPVGEYFKEKLWGGMQAFSGGIGDTNAKDATRRSYWHSCPPDDAGTRPSAVIAGERLIDPDELAALAPAAYGRPSEKPREGARGFDTRINADVLDQARLQDNRSRDAGLIGTVCSFFSDFLKTGDPGATAGKIGDRELYRLATAVTSFCRDSEQIHRAASANYSGYDQDEAADYLTNPKRWEGGPPKCSTIASAGWTKCASCPNRISITSPVQLGDIGVDAPLKPNPDNVQALQTALQAGGLQTVMDTDGQLNVVTTAEVNGRNVRTCTYADSEAATDAIIAMAGAGGKTPSERAIENFKSNMRYSARQRCEAVRVYLRVAEIDGVIYVDLGPGRIQRIDASGCTQVDDTADGVPLFRRGMGAGLLPDPVLFDSPSEAFKFAAGVLSDHFGFSAVQATVTMANLLEWHRTETPHPILEIVGAAGSGKSTTGDFALSLIDPPADGGRVTVGADGKDIAAAAQQRYALQVDNASKIDKATSDLWCIVSTGGVLMVRMLYKQSETANLKLHRVLIVTSVSAVAVAPDLQSRVNRVELQARRSGYVAESELRAALAALRPRMLGALYTLLSGALRELPTVRASGSWGHRLVDFDQMGEAMVHAAGLKPGTFLAAVGQMRERMARRTASGDLFLTAMLQVLRKLAAKPTDTEQKSLRAIMTAHPALSVRAYGDERIEITARPGALHKLMPPSMGYGRSDAMPATERGTSDAIRRVQPLLAGIGVEVRELPFGSKTLIRFDFKAGDIHED